ncbi:MAG: hypothetical protein ACKVWV_04560 [Planctomycetota bacterium]
MQLAHISLQHSLRPLQIATDGYGNASRHGDLLDPTVTSTTIRAA